MKDFLDEVTRLSEEIPYIWPALRRVAQAARGNKLVVKVPKKVITELRMEQVADLAYFWCPKCGVIYERPQQRCQLCRGRLVQAYLGAPRRETPAGTPFVISEGLRLGGRRGGAYDYLFIPIVNAIAIGKCPIRRRRRKLKKVVRLNPERPLASLAYACPYDDGLAKKCQYGREITYNGATIRLCTYWPGYLKMPRRQNETIMLAPPSEALTKAFSIILYKPINGQSVHFDPEFMPGVESISFAKVIVYQLTPMFLAGSPYARKYKRIPVIVYSSDSKLEVLGRKLESEGLLVKLKLDSVRHAINALKSKGFSKMRASEVVICHTMAHLFLITTPLVTGLSEIEFSEAVRADLDRSMCEFLIYDNSPGGIGGVRSLLEETYSGYELKTDFLGVISRRLECPRACLTACKACLFSATCIWLNYALNRHALQYIIDFEEASKYAL